MTVESQKLADIYDISVLLEHSIGDIEFAEELLERFHSRLDPVRQSLEACLRNGDLEEAARVAHSLKGEAGTVAAHRLHDVAASLEQSLRGHNGLEPTELLSQLQEAVAQCLDAELAARDALGRATSPDTNCPCTLSGRDLGA